LDWRAAARRLHAAAGEDWLQPAARRFIEESEAGPLAVGCSGGADSVFLLLWCCGSAEAGGVVRSVPRCLHFNHALRGDESDEDERFVRELARALGAPFRSARWRRDPDAPAPAEETARKARMDFFAREAGAVQGSLRLLLAHHGDDVAETMLMRLSRGSGLEGLAAPRALSEPLPGARIARPLLPWRKANLVERLEAVGARWREDATNRRRGRYRNRIRLELLPLWLSLADRDPVWGAMASRRRLEEDAAALAAWLEQAWPSLREARGGLGLAPLAALPLALRRRALERLAAEANAWLSPKNVERALSAVEKGGELQLAAGEELVLVVSPDQGAVRFERLGGVATLPLTALPEDAALYLPDGARLRACRVALAAQDRRRIRSGVVSHAETVFLSLPGKLSKSLIVRGRRPGDAYRPCGSSSARKLKDMLIDRKMPQASRDALPLVCLANGAILWVPGLPPNADFLVGPRTRRALKLTCDRPGTTL